ncbi:hypothetical protein ISF_04543 [Cordyceps fumosorosea ARSEF 2679]|uniref:Uncharacterized protein n=1 Tax=Cordyceps fumosorosea (strain ARSEF 2679) TaxID=1081104 RepID=A0A167WIJ5_CORFA|nr:hypothetical protein ISF_04543 [Cordyceps fumosorosea ARSEF 2679]OAA63834.1 hypothetical protein ISF_04543 [Cordyceps fumosorosea ARSEF 2679]
MSSPRDRLRQGLNPLSTSALGSLVAQQQHGTPISAISMASPHLLALQTPVSALQPYNPQEWVPPGAPQMPERQVQYAAEAQASAPPPPPPYSPPRSRQQRPVSTAFEYALAPMSTPSPRISSNLAVHHASPESLPNPSFPPPPGAGGRGGSRDRRFGLPSLGRRKEPEQQQSSPPDAHPTALARRSMGPASFYAPEPQRPVAGPSTEGLPPAARRAASTGALDTPTSSRSRSTSQTRWAPGMPLPPPPPGPPPSGSRSQSVQSIDRNAVPIISPPTRRPPPSGVTSLGPVPPTPADWVDPDAQHAPAPPEPQRSPALAIDTDIARRSNQVTEPLGSASSTGSLSRAGAVRHDKTILQRRTESRHTSHGSIDAVAQSHNVSDIVVPNAANGLGRRLTITKSTPRSAGRPDLPRSGDSIALNDSRNSTPRGPGSAQLPGFETSTPPFSPYQKKPASSSGLALAPKSIPTPPPHKRSGSGSQPRESSRPPPSAGTTASKQAVTLQTADQFAANTIERFRQFAAQESAAASDADRVRLFADFIVNESRLRRERYASAIGEMGSEIFDLTRDLFRPMTNSRRASATSQDWTPSSAGPDRSQLESSGMSSVSDGVSGSAPTSAGISHSPTTSTGGNQNYGGTSYMPSLSPILSMSVSDNPENSSRGRPPSRWWETDSNGDPARGWERSKRESKYMGVSKDQWVEEANELTGAGEGPSSQYPPEKTGWHDQDELNLTPHPEQFSATSTETTPSPATKTEGLDVSRLVTMPPPYPRHHPAVNNNHPELTETRTAVRGLSELSEMDETKEKFALASSKRREDFAKATAERRRALRENLQKETAAGNIGYADAAAIEQDSEAQERDKAKELEKTEYEHFQNGVIVPLNELLSARIAKATDLFDNLASQLFGSGQNDADMPQEEGDDRPELLEKLTLLKWIFETREFLHRTIFDLLTDRNARYRDVVLTPYRLSGNTEKLKSAEEFFAADASNRENAYANEVLNRTRDFRSVVDSAVQHGVALQLSAFWDIAPPLHGLVDSIPPNLEGFEIQMPASEFEENPAYHDHPLQYLFSLLAHAEKSTYQFIESHTNLLCLLHEVKEAVVNGKGRVLETQLQDADGAPITAETRLARAQRMRQDEGRRLTEDLQEKVREVQEQWNSALGAELKTVKERTREWLLETGGWDETLEEGEFVAREESPASATLSLLATASAATVPHGTGDIGKFQELALGFNAAGRAGRRAHRHALPPHHRPVPGAACRLLRGRQGRAQRGDRASPWRTTSARASTPTLVNAATFGRGK